jgi:hypothetical protein
MDTWQKLVLLESVTTRERPKIRMINESFGEMKGFCTYMLFPWSMVEH